APWRCAEGSGRVGTGREHTECRGASPSRPPRLVSRARARVRACVRVCVPAPVDSVSSQRPVCSAQQQQQGSWGWPLLASGPEGLTAGCSMGGSPPRRSCRSCRS
ncbi:Gamma-aminobutyric acid receptor subunit epsilon, partial [Frankliniella fusca]